MCEKLMSRPKVQLILRVPWCVSRPLLSANPRGAPHPSGHALPPGYSSRWNALVPADRRLSSFGPAGSVRESIGNVLMQAVGSSEMRHA